MEAESIATVSALMAMGRLIERLEHRQVEERQNFHKRFARFSKRRNRRRFAEGVRACRRAGIRARGQSGLPGCP